MGFQSEFQFYKNSKSPRRRGSYVWTDRCSEWVRLNSKFSHWRIPKFRLYPKMEVESFCFNHFKSTSRALKPIISIQKLLQTQVSALQDPKACQCLRFDHQSKWAGWGYDDNPKMRGDCSTFRNSSNGKFTPTYRQLHVVEDTEIWWNSSFSRKFDIPWVLDLRFHRSARCHTGCAEWNRAQLAGRETGTFKNPLVI